jgi:CBS domain-containing protein
MSEALMAMDILDPIKLSCTPTMLIPEVLKMFDEHDTEALPIIDNDGKLLGVVEKPTIDHYLRGKVLELHKQIASLG